MTYETVQASQVEQNGLPLGAHMRTVREAMGMDRKEAAAQLRLNEKVIAMIESGDYKTDLPQTFIRGYIRSYGKLLDIPEQQLRDGIEALTPKPVREELASSVSHPAPAAGPVKTATRSMPVSIGNFFMQFFTYLLVITIIGLTGIWWNSHKLTDSQANTVPNDLNQPASKGTVNTALPNAKQTANATAPITSSATSGTAPQNTINPSTTTPAQAIAGTTPTSATPVITTPVTSNVIPAPRKIQQTQAQSSSVVKSAPLSTKRYNVNPENQFAFTQFINDDFHLGKLLDFILFLAIINFCVRKFYSAPYSPLNTPLMARIRINRLPFSLKNGINFNKLFKLANKFKLPSSMQFFTFIAMVSLIGLGNAWWRSQSTSDSVVTAQNSNATAQDDQSPGSHLQLDADLETLAPSSSLNSIMKTALKVSDVQAMMNDFDYLVSQAAATKFALTDPSTEIGQFTYKKKIRRHRDVPKYYYDDNNQNDEAYSNNENSYRNNDNQTYSDSAD